MTNKLLFLLIISLYPIASHANSYGYLGFWYDVGNPKSVPQTKTTRENSSRADADAEIQLFCQTQDQFLSAGTTGCFAITPIENTCVAAAWSHKRGLLRPDNVYIAQDPDFERVGELAHQQCKRENGWFARCEVETVYCSDSEKYSESE